MTLLSRQPPDIQKLRHGQPHTEFGSGRMFIPVHLGVGAEEAQAAAAHLDRVVRAIVAWSTLEGLRRFDVVVDDRLFTPVAFADPADPVVVVPRSVLTQMNAGPLQPDLVHEVAHLALYPARSPFFAEGWAVACSYALSPATYFPFPLPAATESLPEDGRLHAAVASHDDGVWTLGDYLHGGRLHDDFVIRQMPSEANRLAYARAGSFVQHLMAEQGVAAYVGMVEAFNDTPAWDEETALLEYFGAPLAELEKDWRARCGITAPTATAATASGVAVAGMTGWTLWTDEVLGGNTSATLVPEDDGFCIEGKLGNRGALQFAGALRFFYGHPSPDALAACKGLRFEARGDGKNYQVCLATEAAWEPGKEFIYLLATNTAWTTYEIPLSQFYRFTAGEERLRGDQIIALHMRAFGYRNQSVQLAMRHIELYL